MPKKSVRTKRKKSVRRAKKSIRKSPIRPIRSIRRTYKMNGNGNNNNKENFTVSIRLLDGDIMVVDDVDRSNLIPDLYAKTGFSRENSTFFRFDEDVKDPYDFSDLPNHSTIGVVSVVPYSSYGYERLERYIPDEEFIYNYSHYRKENDEKMYRYDFSVDRANSLLFIEEIDKKIDKERLIAISPSQKIVLYRRDKIKNKNGDIKSSFTLVKSDPYLPHYLEWNLNFSGGTIPLAQFLDRDIVFGRHRFHLTNDAIKNIVRIYNEFNEKI